MLLYLYIYCNFIRNIMLVCCLFRYHYNLLFWLGIIMVILIYMNIYYCLYYYYYIYVYYLFLYLLMYINYLLCTVICFYNIYSCYIYFIIIVFIC